VPWSLLPFNNMSSLLEAGAEWHMLTSTEAGDVASGIDVYEVIWTETQVSEVIISWKWRGYVDSKTSLLNRIERWVKSTGDGDYHLINATEVSYPDVEQVRSIMHEIQN